MSQTDEHRTGNDRAVTNRVQSALSYMHETRQEFQDARQVGSLDDALHVRFQASLITCHDEMRPFRKRAKDQWSDAGPLDKYENGLSALPYLVSPQTTQKRESKWGGRVKTVVEREPQLLGEATLLEISYAIDEIAEEIGFEPAPKANPEDLHGGRL